MNVPVYDVAVIGGGIAGASIARVLAPDRSVVVLEQEAQLALHSTGRSAAAFLETYGPPAVCTLSAWSRAYLEAGADDTPLLSPRPLLWVAGEEAEGELATMRAEHRLLVGLTAAEARQVCPVLRPEYVTGAAIEEGAQDIDVMALHGHELRTARRAGAEVLLGAEVLSVERSGGSWCVTTPAGEIRAAVLVNAAGAWADEVARRCGARRLGLRPLRRTIAIARPGQGGIDSTLPLVASVDGSFYFKPEGPNVLVSPADETPTEPGDARPDELDVALAIERVNDATTLGIRSIVSAWAGLRTFGADGNPVVGPDPEVEGFFWFAGQGGYGIQIAPALAELGGALLDGGSLPAEVSAVAQALAPSRFSAATDREPSFSDVVTAGSPREAG